jgi:cell division septum initiation protein DivIVA
MNNDFSIIRKGYDPQQVDSYITSLENIINKYREKEKAITQAIVSAQVISEQLISNAKNEAEQIKKDAKIRLSKMQSMLDAAEENLKEFQEDYGKLVSKYLVQFDEKNFQSLLEELHSIRDSFVLKENVEQDSYEKTQAQRLFEQVNNEQPQGISKEEMDSLFGKPQ